MLDAESRGVYINDATASTMNLLSTNDLIGKSMFDISPVECAHRITKTDKTVVHYKSLKMVEDEVILSDGDGQPFLTIKAPW